MLETDNSIINLMDTGPLDIEGEMVCEMMALNIQHYMML